jgi:6-phosphofructokinase 1
MRRQVGDLLKALDIHGLIVLGGDGSLRGAKEFHQETCIPVVGIPASIDNDIPGTDMCIGFDTARNIAADAINKINETAEAHHRIFIVEVMGRDSGQLALSSALASGAEIVIIPERDPAQRDRIDRIANLLKAGFDAGRRHAVVVVAEGVKLLVPTAPLSFCEFLKIRFAEIFKGTYPVVPDIRLVVLSHLQRGGCPTVADRILAARFGEKAVESLVNWDKQPKMVALIGNEIKLQDISVVDDKALRQAAEDKLLELYALCKTLARVAPLKPDQPILEPPDKPSA